MKTLSFSNIPSIDFNFDDRDNRTQQQKNYEYSLQALSNLMASDDFDGVREQLVKDEAQAYENEYMQAAANNLTQGKTTVQDTVRVIDNFVEADNSPAVSLEKKTSETLLSELAADYPEVYAKYINKPEQFTKDSDYITNVILADEMYRRYSESYANTKHLVSVGAEVVSSIGVSLMNLGAPYEGAKQAYKLNKLKDIIDFDEDIITPTALGHNLRTVFNKNAKEMSPTEFKQFVDKFEEAIKDIPSVYQQEILEWAFEGYQPVDNLFMVSDIEDLGKIGKAIQNFNKAGVQKKVGNMTKALDDIIVREEEALSATAKADVTEATVAKNNKRVKKDVVKKVVKEEVDKAFENVDTTPETSEVAFATQLTEAKHIDEVSDATPKSVIDHKNWADQNATLIGRVDGTPFATYEEATRAARDMMINRAEEQGYKVLSAMSRSDYKTPSLKKVNTGEGTQIEGTGLYYTLHRPNNILNSSLSYQIEFRNFLPSDVNNRLNYGADAVQKYIQDKYLVEVDKIPFKGYVEVLEDIGRDYEALRRDGWAVRNTLNTLEKRYSKAIEETEDFQRILNEDPTATVEDFIAFEVNNKVEEDVLKYLTFKTMTKDVKDFKEPVNKYFLLKPQAEGKFLNKSLLGEPSEDKEILENILKVFDKYNIVKRGAGGKYSITDLAKDMSDYEEGNVYNIRHVEELLAYKIKERSKVKTKPFIEYMKQARDILKNEAGIRGSWHSNVNLMHYYDEDIVPFFTFKPTVKGGKVSYSRRLDNPELLKYYTEPVQVNNQWYVKIYNNDVDLIKIKGN